MLMPVYSALMGVNRQESLVVPELEHWFYSAWQEAAVWNGLKERTWIRFMTHEAPPTATATPTTTTATTTTTTTAAAAATTTTYYYYHYHHYHIPSSGSWLRWWIGRSLDGTWSEHICTDRHAYMHACMHKDMSMSIYVYVIGIYAYMYICV